MVRGWFRKCKRSGKSSEANISRTWTPEEILLDNSAAFRLRELASMCYEWGVRLRFRAAYRPLGNGIIERNYRTVKRGAARTGQTPEQVVFWYNIAPKKNTDKNTVPSTMAHAYSWRHALMKTIARSEKQDHKFKLGENVLVKPPNVDCTKRWTVGKETEVESDSNILVDGLLRHVLDIRRIVDDVESKNSQFMQRKVVSDRHLQCIRSLFETDDEAEDQEEQEQIERPVQCRKPPAWLEDYVE